MRYRSLAFCVFASTALATISPNGKCGGSAKYSCIGYWEGECCSQYGYCGRTSAYCGTGCQSAFGLCNGVALSRASSSTRASSLIGFQTSTRSSSVAPSSTQLVSTNARCGPSFGGRTCQGSRWGNCCSQYWYCGSNTDYCAADTCQKGYGTCNSAVSSSARSSSNSRVSSTSRTLSSTAISSRSSSTSMSSLPLSTPTSFSGSSSSSLIETSTSSSVSSTPSPSSDVASTSTSSSPVSSSSMDMSTAISTPSDTPTPTPSSTTPVDPAPTTCSDAQESYCYGAGGCGCSLALDHTNAYCWDYPDCVNCASDANCRPGYRCAYAPNGICGTSRTWCVETGLASSCDLGDPPVRSAKRDLEKVFMNVGRKFKRT